MLDTLQFGHSISLRKDPELVPPSNKWTTNLETGKMEVVREKVAQLALKGAIEEVSWRQAEEIPGLYSRLFCVPKRTSEGQRAIIDLSRFNEYVGKKSFRMSTIRDVKCSVTKGAFGTTIDLEDAFYHIPLHKESRKYTRFMLDGRIWQFTCLPMGLTSSPRVFTELTRTLARYLRKRGMIIIIYLDDILILSGSERLSRKDTQMVQALLLKLGFLVNFEKSSIDPQQRFLYLGLWWDLRNWTISLAHHRWDRLRRTAHRVRRAQFSTCRAVAAMVGLVQSATEAVPLARARVRKTQREFIKACGVDNWDRKFSLSRKARQELLFWENLPEETHREISLSPASQKLSTDASDKLVGWYFNGELFSESVEEKEHINVKELLALQRALLVLGPRLQPGYLVWEVDNSAAQFAILNQGSNRSERLCSLAVDILLLAVSPCPHRACPVVFGGIIFLLLDMN